MLECFSSIKIFDWKYIIYSQMENIQDKKQNFYTLDTLSLYKGVSIIKIIAAEI